MLLLSHDELIGLLRPDEIVDAVEASLRAQTANSIIMPKRLHLDWGDNTLLTMPAAGGGGFGVKLVSVVPGNAARGLPVTNGVMVLNDGATGLPIAIMNAAALTAQRTGAVGSLGVKYATPAAISSVGIIGCGLQGAWQAVFACAVRPIREIFCFSRSMANFDRFATVVNRHAPGVAVTPCTSASALLERTRVVIAATTSMTPVLPDDPGQLENGHFISVGSFKPTMQELPDSVYRLAGLLAVDSQHARHEVGDVINPVTQGILKEADIFSIAECVAGTRILDTFRTTAYKSVGAASYDLFVAQAFYKAARSRGLGLEVAL